MDVQSVASFLQYLDRVHERTRKVVACVREEDLEWQAAPGRMTCGDMIRHLAGIERYMYAETVHGRPTRYPGHGQDVARGLDHVVAYYDGLHADSRAQFAALTDGRLQERCLTPAGAPIRVGKWLRAMLEHEAHHRGQLYFVLGMRGVATPPIYGLTSEEVHARSQLPRRHPLRGARDQGPGTRE